MSENKYDTIEKILREEVGYKQLSQEQSALLFSAMKEAKRKRTLWEKWLDLLEYEVEIDLYKLMPKRKIAGNESDFVMKNPPERVISLLPITVMLCLILTAVSFPYSVIHAKNDVVIKFGSTPMICKGGIE